jgi:tetratricopeptide (TPR) repeat protein
MLRKNRRKDSSASTDQSSTAENIFNPRANNDQQHLLVQTSNRFAADWYDANDDLDFDGDSSPWQAPAVVTPSKDSPVALLSFPTPRDRSLQARRQVNREKGIMHAYDGEIEPEGMRGQEAKVKSTSGKSPEIALRSFSGVPRSGLGVLGPVVEDDDSTFMDERSSALPPVLEGPVRAASGDEVSQTSSQYLASMIKTEFNGRNVKSNRNYHRGRGRTMGPSGDGFIKEKEMEEKTPVQLRVAHDHAVSGWQSKPTKNPSDYMHARLSAPVNVDDSSFQDPLQNAQGIHAMAMEHVMRGEYDMALQAFSQVLTAYLEKYGRAHPMTASAYHNLGTVHSKRAGMLIENSSHQRHCREQALLCFQAAARSARDAPQLGPSHPNVAVSLVRIGFLLLQSQQYQNAVITFTEALRIRIDHYGPTHALVANLYNNLGVCHMHMQEFVVGRRFLQQALDIQKDLLGQDEYSVTALLELADTLCNIGGLCLEWIRQQGPDPGHALDGESACLEALEVRVKVLGEDHVLTNQVRSLYDMVRSIPLAKVSQPKTSVSPQGRSLPRLENSVMPDTLPATPGRTRKDPPGLDHPNLRRAPSPPSFADLDASYQSTRAVSFDGGDHQSSGVFSDAELNAYEATEENFVLDHPENEDGQMTVISYAQSAASIPSSTQRETERLAYLMQAKAILDAHRNPQISGKDAVDVSTGARKHSENMEDGLVPLGGDWPEQTEERMTPAILRDPARHLRTIHGAASNFFKRGRYREALHLLEIVVETQQSRHGPIHQDVGSAVHNVGIVQLRLGENHKALQAFEEAVRVRKGALGRDHPHVAVSLVKVGITLMLLKRLGDSLWIFREALAVRQQCLGPTHPSTARIYNNIGCVHVEFGESHEAKKAFEGALQIQRKALEKDPDSGPVLFGSATTLQNLAYLYRQNGMHEKEAVVLRESLGVSFDLRLGSVFVDYPPHLSIQRFKKRSWVSFIQLSWGLLKVLRERAASLVTMTMGSSTTRSTWNVFTKWKTKI